MKDAAVIIVNWNGEKLLGDCLDSLRRQTYGNFEIILVDNGSRDSSIPLVKNNYPEVEIIALKENTGFAHANNLGISKAFENRNIKYIITLNNDTKVEKSYVEELVRFAKKHPRAGSIQPKVVNFFNPEMIDGLGILIYPDMSASDRGQKEIDCGQYEKEEEIFGASASAALYSREALEKTKLPEENYFDSDYFAYSEDVDLAWRLRLRGWSSFYCPTARAFHVHSATGKNYSSFKSFHIFRNQYYNIFKNLPFGFMLRALAFMPVRYCFLLLSVIKKKGPASKAAENNGTGGVVWLVFRAWLQVLRNLPALWRKRRIIQKGKMVSNSEIHRWMKIYRADFRKMVWS